MEICPISHLLSIFRAQHLAMVARWFDSNGKVNRRKTLLIFLVTPHGGYAMKQYRVHSKTPDGWMLVDVFATLNDPKLCAEELWAFDWLEKTAYEYVKLGYTMYDIVEVNQSESESI